MKEKDNKEKEINDLLEEIFLTYRKQIYLLALKYLRDEKLAEDIVQESIIRIREKIVNKEISSCHKLGSLIGYIVKGLCVNLIRRNQKVIYREIFDDEIKAEDESIRAIILNDTICKLPDAYRDVFMMKFVKDMSYKEIGKALNLSEVAVRKRMERARKMVKQVWGDGEDE